VLIRDHGYGGRRAHRICATMVRIARERGIRPQEVTGELLDEAARIADETPPGLTSEVIREALDPVKFIERHDNVGDPHPRETLRMAGSRRQALAAVTGRQSLRKQRIEEAAVKLSAEVVAICSSHASNIKPEG
jgi:argininosuccinate lyase